MYTVPLPIPTIPKSTWQRVKTIRAEAERKKKKKGNSVFQSVQVQYCPDLARMGR